MSRRNCRLQFPKEKKENSFLYQCNKFPVPYSHNTAGKKRRKNCWQKLYKLAKTKIQKTWVFCCTVYTARKTRISYLCFGKWCACATSLYLWPYTCSAHYVAGRGRVIPLKVMYHVTKNQIIPARLERAFTLAKNQWNFGGVSKNHAAEVGFSIQVFWSV